MRGCPRAASSNRSRCNPWFALTPASRNPLLKLVKLIVPSLLRSKFWNSRLASSPPLLRVRSTAACCMARSRGVNDFASAIRATSALRSRFSRGEAL